MRKLIYLLMTMPLFIASCSNEDMAITEETVEVNFCAELPKRMGTRATSTLSVDKVYCAVFENDTEITTLREVITIENGSDIVFSPRLIKGRTYDVVFWAAKDGSYNVEDMTSITRNSNANMDEENFDAFTAHTSITVNNSTQEKDITLTRPLAQLNMGVTQEDWNGVASENTFNMTPTSITISLTGKDTFNALTGSPIGADKNVTYNLSVSGHDFMCAEETYKNIAMCYVFPDAQKENFDITYTIYDQSENAIRENVVIYAVPLEANYKTNVVGGLLTGTVTYNISLEEDFNATENNKEIE